MMSDFVTLVRSCRLFSCACSLHSRATQVAFFNAIMNWNTLIGLLLIYLTLATAESVLFVGNSYTYTNNLDQVFADLWRSSTYSSIYATS